MDESMTSPSDCSFSSPTNNMDEKTRNVVIKQARKKLLKAQRSDTIRQKRREMNHITESDFLSKKEEFRMWLSEERNGLRLEDLEAKDVKIFFKKFIKRWNYRHLPKKYYRGIDKVLGNAKTPRVKHSMKVMNTSNSDCENTPKNSLSFLDSTLTNSIINLSEVEGNETPKTTFSTFGKSTIAKKPSIKDFSDTLSIYSNSTVFTYDTVSLSSYTSSAFSSRFDQHGSSESSGCCDDWSFSSASDYGSITSLSELNAPGISIPGPGSNIAQEGSGDFPSKCDGKHLSSFKMPYSVSSNKLPCSDVTNHNKYIEEMSADQHGECLQTVTVPDKPDINEGTEKEIGQKMKRGLKSFRNSRRKLMEKVSSFIHEPKVKDKQQKLTSLKEKHEFQCPVNQKKENKTPSTAKIILERYMDGLEEAFV